jgi:hypothetical protein
VQQSARSCPTRSLQADLRGICDHNRGAKRHVQSIRTFARGLYAARIDYSFAKYLATIGSASRCAKLNTCRSPSSRFPVHKQPAMRPPDGTARTPQMWNRDGIQTPISSSKFGAERALRCSPSCAHLGSGSESIGVFTEDPVWVRVGARGRVPRGVHARPPAAPGTGMRGPGTAPMPRSLPVSDPGPAFSAGGQGGLASPSSRQYRS